MRVSHPRQRSRLALQAAYASTGIALKRRCFTTKTQGRHAAQTARLYTKLFSFLSVAVSRAAAYRKDRSMKVRRSVLLRRQTPAMCICVI